MKQRTKNILTIVFLMLVCVALSACKAPKFDPSDGSATIQNCWTCAIYGSVFNFINSVVKDSVSISLSVAQFLLGAGLLLFLLKQVGSIMIFASEADMQKTMKETGFTILKAMVIAAIIYRQDWFMQTIKDVLIYPIGSFIMMMGNAVLDSIPESSSYFSGVQGLSKDGSSLIEIGGKLVPFDEPSSLFGDIGIQVQYIVARLFASFKGGFDLGKRIIQEGDMYAWAVGLFFMWEVADIMFIFPFAFVDAFLILVLYTTLFPIALALWVFPQTKKYFSKVFPAPFISPFLDILFGIIIVTLMMSMVQIYHNVGLGNLMSGEAQVNRADIAEGAANGKPNIIIMILLIMCVKKMALNISDFSAQFGGEAAPEGLFATLKKVHEAVKKIVAQVALAVVSGGGSVAATVAQEASKEAAKKAMAAAAESMSKAAPKKELKDEEAEKQKTEGA